MTGFEDTGVCRFATLELVRGEWRRYLNNLSTGNEEVFSNNATQFDISVVNYEENAHRSPVPYNLPPGIERETMYGATSFTQQNEQAMVLKIRDLEDGDARAAFKNVTMDMRNYEKIEMYAHAESIEEYGLLLGAIVPILLYLILLFRSIRISLKTKSMFGGLVAIGLIFSIVLQAYINMFVSVNIIPVTRQTLPLISMGGTSILFTCITIGIVFSISRDTTDRDYEKA